MARRRVGRPRVRRTRRRRGGNIFTDAGNWIKNAARTVYDKALVPAHDFIKRNKLVSRGLALIPHPAGKAAALGASVAGYGRRRHRGGYIGWLNPVADALAGHGRKKRTVRRRGRGVADILKKAHAYVKKEKLISRALKNFGHTKLGNAAAALGYGRRKRTVRRRGRGLGDILKKAHAYIKKERLISRALKNFGHTKLGNAAGALGYGKRKRRVVRRRGRGLADILKKAHAYVKKERLVSRALRNFGHTKLANAAGALGYGRRRMHGGANFFTTEQIAAPKY